jgi:hypothetical protein
MFIIGGGRVKWVLLPGEPLGAGRDGLAKGSDAVACGSDVEA